MVFDDGIVFCTFNYILNLYLLSSITSIIKPNLVINALKHDHNIFTPIDNNEFTEYSDLYLKYTLLAIRNLSQVNLH